MFNKKAITPIIAVILLLMMVIAGAAAAFFWFNQMQSGLQGNTEVYSEGLSTKIAARIEIAEIDSFSSFNTTNSVYVANGTFYLKNVGSKTITINNSKISAILKDQDGTICSGTLDTYALNCTYGCNGTLSPKRIQKIFIEFSNADCGDIISGKYSINFDFGGDTATGTDFSVRYV